MGYSYPLLHKVFDYYRDESPEIGDIYLVCCQHVLEPQLEMFKLLIEFGFIPDKIFVLGKAYSTNKEVFDEFEAKGIKILQPDFSGKAFDEEHKINCKHILELIPENAQVIILDDGAELIKTFSDSKRNILFAVEQTSSGFRKLEKENIHFPVVNVARASTKLVQESPLIARLCFERMKEYFNNNNIRNPIVLVVGLGPIGEATFEIFKQNNFAVHGFDIKHGHTDILKTIKNMNPDIIIGATGTQILFKEDIETLEINKSIHFISVSSSDKEFPVAAFRIGNEVHSDVVYKNITFVNNGFPITFKGNRYESTPIEIEKTICLLGGSVVSGVLYKIEEKGLVSVPKVLEDLINS